MHKCGPCLRDPVDFAWFQVDRMAKKGAFPDQTMGFVGVEVVAGLREEITHPCDFVGLFAEVCLHQAIGVFGPKRAEGRKLIWC